MKKSLLIIAILMLVAGFSGKVFAQITSGTPMLPSEGTSVTYVLNGLTTGDTYVYGVNQTEGEFSNGAGDGSLWNITSTGSSVGGDGRASATIEWLEGSKDIEFFVWIQITDGEGCSTYRYLPVTPQEATPVVEAYAVNFGILAMGTGDNTGIDNAVEGTNVTSCPAFFEANWRFESLDDATTHDGSSYVYFRITRSAELNGESVSVDQWSITPSLAASSIASASDWGYAAAPGQSFTSYSIGNAITVSSGNVIYVRARVQNTDASNQTLALEIADGDDIGTALDETITYIEQTAALTITPVPTVGTFSDSY